MLFCTALVFYVSIVKHKMTKFKGMIPIVTGLSGEKRSRMRIILSARGVSCMIFSSFPILTFCLRPWDIDTVLFCTALVFYVSIVKHKMTKKRGDM